MGGGGEKKKKKERHVLSAYHPPNAVNYTYEVTHDITPILAVGGTASILQMRKLRFGEVKNITKQVRDTAQN